MKRFLALLLATVLMLCCLFAVGCQKPEEPEVPTPTPGGGDPEEGDKPDPLTPRFFLAGYDRLIPQGDASVSVNGRLLLSMNSDGTLDVYTTTQSGETHKKAHYTGTYSFGVNDENDETLTFSYTHDGTTETVTEAVIIDGVFSTPFYLIDSMTPSDVKFYEATPTALDGEAYLGYMTKDAGAMGRLACLYALNLKADGTFNVSIMYLSAVMHVFGESTGTYTVEGDKITLTYDLSDGEGGVAAEDFVSEGTKNADGTISTSFNIAISSPRAAEAIFIKIK